MTLQRVTFLLTHKETHDDKIASYNDKFGSISLTEPIDLQKEKTSNDKAFSKVILIVEDDPDMTLVFSLGLQDEGFNVYTYNDPLEVLRELYPTRSIGCYIKKPVTIEQLVKRVKAELE